MLHKFVYDTWVKSCLLELIVRRRGQINLISVQAVNLLT